MSRFYAFPDPSRAVIRIAGEDRVSFLQGLVTNDVRKVSPGHAVWAALLTPQGRYLHDFFIHDAGEWLALDVEAARAEDLMRRLKLYKLRAKVTLETVSDWGVAVAWDSPLLPTSAHEGRRLGGGGGYAGQDVLVAPDPRHSDLGFRLVGPSDELVAVLEDQGFTPADIETWENRRLNLGIPSGTDDLVPEKSLLLENGFDELNGVAWDKGCYIGQELTARTKYRGLVKKRLFPVRIDGPVPPSGSIITLDGHEAGEMRSGRDGLGLALLRLDAIERSPLTVGETTLIPGKPDWLLIQKAD